MGVHTAYIESTCIQCTVQYMYSNRHCEQYRAPAFTRVAPGRMGARPPGVAGCNRTLFPAQHDAEACRLARRLTRCAPPTTPGWRPGAPSASTCRSRSRLVLTSRPQPVATCLPSHNASRSGREPLTKRRTLRWSGRSRRAGQRGCVVIATCRCTATRLVLARRAPAWPTARLCARGSRRPTGGLPRRAAPRAAGQPSGRPHPSRSRAPPHVCSASARGSCPAPTCSSAATDGRA